MENKYKYLITLKGFKADPQLLLLVRPRFVLASAFAEPPERIQNDIPPLVAVFGRTHQKAQTFTPLQYATLLEATRFGLTVATNSNFGKPRPLIYSKLCFRDAPQDNMPLSRFFANAGEHEAVKHFEFASDLRPQNLVKFGAGKPKKEAVDVTLKHVQRIAEERTVGGTFPNEFTKDEYLDNFLNLLTAMLKEATEFYGGDAS